jgi:hypothetical protein
VGSDAGSELSSLGGLSGGGATSLANGASVGCGVTSGVNGLCMGATGACHSSSSSAFSTVGRGGCFLGVSIVGILDNRCI